VGGTLVKLAYAACADEGMYGQPLTMNERGVLIYMCAVAMDDAKPPRYWGGRESIIKYALGRDLPAKPTKGSPDPAAEKLRRSIFEIDGLIARKAIERIGEAYPGRNQEYAITVDNLLEVNRPKQGQIGSLASTDWAKNNLSLPKTQPHIGPETKQTNRPTEKPKSSRRAPHFEPVDNDADSSIAI